jgi:formylglycine-generating enzyme required for sulfatase activity
MNKNILTLIALVIVSLTSAFSQRDTRLHNMHFIPEGVLVEDSGRKVTFASFWISNQVTNEEFREFWNDVKNNPQEELIWGDMTTASQPIVKKIGYSEILKDTLDSTKWPTEHYFEAREFNDSPVIGVSEDLAKLYCIWKTNMTYDKLKEDERDPVSPYFLPPTLQLKYAQKSNPKLFSDNEVGFRIIIMR